MRATPYVGRRTLQSSVPDSVNLHVLCARSGHPAEPSQHRTFRQTDPVTEMVESGHGVPSRRSSGGAAATRLSV